MVKLWNTLRLSRLVTSATALRTAAAASARPLASLLARPAAVLLTRTARARRKASNCIGWSDRFALPQMPPETAAFFLEGELL